MDNEIIISKSKYLYGLQCLRYLWYQINAKEEIPQPSFVGQFIFNQGIQVGEYAKKLYPEGIDAGIVGKFNEHTEQRKGTLEILKERKPVFEAGCRSGNVYCRADILVPAEEASWDIIEVKSSTRVKEENIHDIAFQKFCFESAGIKIKRCYIACIDSNYTRKGSIEPEKLFRRVDVTAEAEEARVGIEERVREMLDIAGKESPPEISIGRQCSEPYECPLKDKCWGFLPENNVFNLYGNKDRAIELYREGILSIEDIPDQYDLNYKQQIQYRCVKTKEPMINKKEISKFIENLKYPLYFFDFETFSTAIPLYDGVKPYQRIPFQYSIHLLRSIDGQPEHYDFLAADSGDPRKKLLESLRKHIGDAGSIIVYYEQFEKGVLRELAEAFPEYKGWVDSIIPRIVDLYKPFGNFYYYHHLQKGSASVKSVLPAVTGLGYNGMEIADGMAASVYFLYTCGYYNDLISPYPGSCSKPDPGNSSESGPSEEEIERIRNSLIKYCRLDTGGMIHILRALIKEASR